MMMMMWNVRRSNRESFYFIYLLLALPLRTVKLFKWRIFTVATDRSCSSQVAFLLRIHQFEWKWSASLQRFSGMQKADMFTVVRAQTKEPLDGVRAYVHACTARLELWNSQYWNKFQKLIKHFSSQNAGLKQIKKRETFWVKQRSSHPPLQGGGGAWTVWRTRPRFPTMHCITWHRNGSGGLPASSPGRLLSEHRNKSNTLKVEDQTIDHHSRPVSSWDWLNWKPVTGTSGGGVWLKNQQINKANRSQQEEEEGL